LLAAVILALFIFSLLKTKSKFIEFEYINLRREKGEDKEKEKKPDSPDIPEGQRDPIANPRSKFAFMKVISSYFNSEWSFAQFRIKDRKAKLVFSHTPYFVYIAGCDGQYYIINFETVNGGVCTTKFEGSFLNQEQTDII